MFEYSSKVAGISKLFSVFNGGNHYDATNGSTKKEISVNTTTSILLLQISARTTTWCNTTLCNAPVQYRSLDPPPCYQWANDHLRYGTHDWLIDWWSVRVWIHTWHWVFREKRCVKERERKARESERQSIGKKIVSGLKCSYGLHVYAHYQLDGIIYQLLCDVKCSTHL